LSKHTIIAFAVLSALFFVSIKNVLADGSADAKEDGKTEEKQDKKPEKLLNLTLDELVVVGTRDEQKLESLSGTASVIPARDVEAAYAVSAEELIDTVPGVSVQGSGQYGDKIILSMRGLQGLYGAQRVLVLVDGRPANEEYLGDFDFRMVPVEAIERVEISKGPASALYGGLAIGGVINIVTKDPLKEKKGTFTASLGSHNTRNYTATFSSGGKSLAALVTGGGFATDGYLKNSDLTNRDWESGRFFSKIVKKLANGSEMAFSAGTTYGTSHEEDFKLNQVKEFQYLRLKKSFSDRQKLIVRIFRNGNYNEYAWKFGMDARYHQYTAGAQAQFEHKFAEKNTLTAGVEGKTQKANVGELTGHIEEQITESAVYAQEKLGAGKFEFTIGARIDNNDEFGSQVSPRAGITFKPADGTVLRMAGGKAYRPPTISDLYLPPTTFMGMIFKGNPDLEPETLWSGELGVRKKLKVAGKQVSVDAAVFRSRGEDFWDYMVVNFVPLTLQPLNVNVVEISGSELEIAILMSRAVKLTLGYTYTNARYAKYEPDPTIEHNHVEEIPQHWGSANLAYRSKEGHTAGIELKAVGDRFADAANTKATKLHGYWTIAVVGKAKISESTYWFGRVDNLTDEKYRSGMGQIQPGRTFSIGFGLDL